MSSIDRGRLEELLSGLCRAGGMALHLRPGRPPWIRLEGKLVDVGGDPISVPDLDDLLREFLFADHRLRLDRGEEVEVLFASQGGDRFRTAVLPTEDGTHLVFRRVPDRPPTFAEAGLPEMLVTVADLGTGLCVMTGFHGSGKRSTLAAIVDRINAERPVHLVSIERHIEFVHRAQRALVHQRELGTHVASVAEGIRQAQEQGADVLAVGDLESAADLDAVLGAVERGMLVLCSFEASCVVGAVADLQRLVPADERPRLRHRLAAALRVIVAQTLVRRRHGRGRVPLLEILVRDEAVVRAIRRGRQDLLPELMMRGRGLGMQTVDMALRALLEQHQISADEAAWHASDRDWVLAR
jgi:twitching motility protein PilT